MRYSCMRQFGEIEFVLENLKWQTILHVFIKKKGFILKKVNTYYKIKENKSCMYTLIFLFRKKVVCTILVELTNKGMNLVDGSRVYLQFSCCF